MIFNNPGVMRRLLYYVQTRRHHRETIKQLNALTDAQLRDIGINRNDLNRLIWMPEDFANRGRGKNEN